MSTLLKDKFVAFSSHLVISVAIATLAAILIYFVWFPNPYHFAMGVSKVTLILIGVDLVIGPILTFILFKKGKKGLWFDMAVVIILQAGAFVYGIGTIFEKRPLYAVFSVDRFEVVSSKHLVRETDDPDVVFSEASLKSRPWVGPRYLFVEAPSDPVKAAALTEAILFKGKPDYAYLPYLYQAYEPNRSKVLAKLAPLAALKDKYPKQADYINKQVAKLGRDIETLKYAPLATDNGFASLMVDASSAEVLGGLKIDPWQ